MKVARPSDRGQAEISGRDEPEEGTSRIVARNCFDVSSSSKVPPANKNKELKSINHVNSLLTITRLSN